MGVDNSESKSKSNDENENENETDKLPQADSQNAEIFEIEDSKYIKFNLQ